MKVEQVDVKTRGCGSWWAILVYPLYASECTDSARVSVVGA